MQHVKAVRVSRPRVYTVSLGKAQSAAKFMTPAETLYREAIVAHVQRECIKPRIAENIIQYLTKLWLYIAIYTMNCIKY